MIRNPKIPGLIVSAMAAMMLCIACSSALGESKYFPKKVLSQTGKPVIFDGKRYADILRGMGEPPLYGTLHTGDTEVYRIIWIGNDRYTRGFRLSRSGEDYRFRYVVLAGVNDFLDYDETIRLGTGDWKQLTSGLAGVDFCGLPAIGDKPRVGPDLHSNAWLFEIVTSGRYCMLIRADSDVERDESRRLHVLFKLLFKRAIQQIENR
jgi:hypothetical protein